MSATLSESGTSFLLPPHHRLFAVFDDPEEGRRAIQQLAEHGITGGQVWRFVGERGARSVDPTLRHHGLPTAIVRVLQRIYTNDCEYAASLADALRKGALVLAVRTEPEEVEALAQQLEARAGHSFAYGDHRTFMPLAHSGHAIGAFPTRKAS